MAWLPEQTLADFATVARLAGVSLAADDIRIEALPAPHAPPTRLPAGQMAVYVFTYGRDVLKVGKVGPKSQARYTSQHYNPGSAQSTLAASMIADTELGRDDNQALGTILADPMHLPAAARAFETFRLDDLLDPRLVPWQVSEVPVDRGALPARRCGRRVGLFLGRLDLPDRDGQILEGQLALVLGQLLRSPAVEREAQFLDQRLLAPIGLCKQVDPSLQCLERRPMLGRQEAQIEIIRTGLHGPDYIAGSEV